MDGQIKSLNTMCLACQKLIDQLQAAQETLDTIMDEIPNSRRAHEDEELNKWADSVDTFLYGATSFAKDVLERAGEYLERLEDLQDSDIGLRLR